MSAAATYYRPVRAPAFGTVVLGVRQRSPLAKLGCRFAPTVAALFLNRGYRAQNLKGAKRCGEPIFYSQFRVDPLQVRAHGIVSDSENCTDDRTAFTDSNPVKDFCFALRET